MLKTLKVRNFKSLKAVDLNFGRLNFVIGSNASGKSNLFDALRFLQGVGNGFSLGEIIDGKPKSATASVWEPIRGGSSLLPFSNSPGAQITFDVSVRLGQYKTTEWRFGFRPETLRVCYEKFGSLFDSAAATNDADRPFFKAAYYGKARYKRPPHYEFEPSRPIISQFPHQSKKGVKEEREEVANFLLALANTQRVDPWPATLREYSQAHSIERMGEHGENFAALVKAIISDRETKEAFLTWLRHLRPAEVDDIKILEGAVKEPLFCLVEGQREFPAPVLSDGTLRFTAIAAALFQPDMPGIMTIEEIENGIHASRLRLLVELLRSQAEQAQTQLFVTTHSPVILSWLKREELDHTFYCKRDEESGESRIVPVTSIPHFKEVVEKQSVSDLFAEGWMEASL